MSKKIIIIYFLLCIGLYSQSYYFYSVETLNINSNIGINSFNYNLYSPNNLTSSLTFTLPNSVGTNGQFLTSLGNGTLTWTTPNLSTANPGGSDRQVQFNNGGAFGGATNLIWEADDQLSVGGTSADYNLDINGNLRTGGEGTDGEVRIFSEQGGTDYEVVFRPNATMTQSTTYTWPANDGPNGDILVTDGEGNLFWTTDGATGSFPCDGQGTGGGSGNEADGDNGFVGGGSGNEITSQASNAIVGGGTNNEAEGDRSAIVSGTNNNTGPSADQSTIGSGDNNQILGDDSIIGSGSNNYIDGNPDSGNNGEGPDGQNFIGSGDSNEIYPNNSVIAGGAENIIDENSDQSAIGTGFSNYIDESEDSGILGGRNNEVVNNSETSVVAGGQDNSINNVSPNSFIGGGLDNEITENDVGIGGGRGNLVSDNNSAILGGRDNSANENYCFVFGRNSSVSIPDGYGLAFGRRAIVDDNRSAAFADANDQDLTTSSDNRLEMRFSNGYRLFSNTAQTTGASLNAGDNSWSTLSDSTLKENITLINQKEILNKILELEITTWNYKSNPAPEDRNYGAMAQTFYRLFGEDELGKFGSDNEIISIHLPALGISATQGLISLIEESEKRVDDLTREQKKIESEIEELKLKILKLEGDISNK